MTSVNRDFRRGDRGPSGDPRRGSDRRIIEPSQSGQTLLEVTLLTPLLLIMLLGVIDLGRFAYFAILVGNAARAGAAYGAEGLPQSVDTTGITAAVDDDFKNNGQNVSTLTVGSSTSCGCDSGGAITSAGCSATTNPNAGLCGSGHWVVMVSVTASGTFKALLNWPGIPKSVALSRTAEMRVADD